MPHCIYIIYSAKIDKFYIGSTSDILEERVRKHNSNHSGFTGRVNDWKLIYKEEFTSKAEARLREKEIKSWKSRVRIQELIGSPE